MKLACQIKHLQRQKAQMVILGCLAFCPSPCIFRYVNQPIGDSLPSQSVVILFSCCAICEMGNICREPSFLQWSERSVGHDHCPPLSRYYLCHPFSAVFRFHFTLKLRGEYKCEKKTELAVREKPTWTIRDFHWAEMGNGIWIWAI